MAMTRPERATVTFACADDAVKRIRLIRSRIKADKHIDPSDIAAVLDTLESLRHHCEMNNAERLNRIGQPLIKVLG